MRRKILRKKRFFRQTGTNQTFKVGRLTLGRLTGRKCQQTGRQKMSADWQAENVSRLTGRKCQQTDRQKMSADWQAENVSRLTGRKCQQTGRQKMSAD